jgi:hypothetical protein
VFFAISGGHYPPTLAADYNHSYIPKYWTVV